MVTPDSAFSSCSSSSNLQITVQVSLRFMTKSLGDKKIIQTDEINKSNALVDPGSKYHVHEKFHNKSLCATLFLNCS